MLRTFLILLSLLVGNAACLAKDDFPSPYVIQTHKYTGGPYQDEEFRYLLLSPENIEPGKKYPLVLFLHGAGQRGDDINRVRAHFLLQMGETKWRRKYPCFIVAPQCRQRKKWTDVSWGLVDFEPMTEQPNHQLRMAVEILQKSLESLPVDRKRLYLTGLSMGGYASWELAMRHPDWFAAVAPICGGGDESHAARLRDVPIWAFHGAKDKAVPVERSRRMIAAIKKAGGQPKYTEYPDLGHDCWATAYKDRKGVIPWMFKHVKTHAK